MSCRRWLAIFMCVLGIGTVITLLCLDFSEPGKRRTRFISYYPCRVKDDLRRQMHLRREMEKIDIIGEIKKKDSGDDCKVKIKKKLNWTISDVKPVPIWDQIDGKTGFPNCPIGSMLLIMVTSAPDHFHRRNVIRKTWGKPQFVHNSWATSVFLIGKSDSLTINALVETEELSTGDVLVGKYRDTYRNLTLKVLNGLAWASRLCRPKFLLKTDDDCFVNVPLVLTHLTEYEYNTKNVYVGRVNWESPVIRDEKSAWFVSEELFNEPLYPPYASGIGYVVSRDVLYNLLSEARKVTPFPNEDAFIGVLARNLGISPISSARFAVNSHNWQLCNFMYLMVLHQVSPSQQRELMSLATLAQSKCPREDNLNTWH